MIKIIDDEIYEINDDVLVNTDLDKYNTEEVINELDDIIDIKDDYTKDAENYEELISIPEDNADSLKIFDADERNQEQDRFIDKVMIDLDNEIRTSTNDYDVDDIDLAILDNNEEIKLTDEEIDRILDEDE